ncbi:MAG: diguanylate cyclase, partial [Rubrivivax sp.]|nr:diguanylate cyclase [Pyrinomonadaceae bacterium]
MDMAEGQRFPNQFVRALIAVSVCVAAFTVYRLPFAQIGFPLLLLALLAVQIASRFETPDAARDNWHFPFAEGFVFLTMLLFDGEAAVLLAATVALCSSLTERKGASSLAFRAALAATTTFVVVWTLRLTSGVLTDIAGHALSTAALTALCVAALTQSLIRASVAAIGGSYRINQSVFRDGTRTLFWQLVGNFAAVAAALLVALCVRLVGAGASVSIGAGACILAFVIRARFFGEHGTSSASEPRDKASENDRFRSAFDFAAIGMAMVSTEGRWLQVNRSLCHILGYTETELLATDFLSVTHPDDLPTALSNIGQLLKGKVQASQMEKRYIHKLGHEVWVHWSVSMVRDQYSTAVHLIFQIQDITDRKLAEQQLHHDAFHDALTGLPNRALFMDHLKLSIARSQRSSTTMFAVLYLDLDRFKIINDSLGHTIGDQLLVGIADRLKKHLRPGDTVARLGGDEFTILIEDITDEKEAVQVAERIQNELAAPFALSGREVFTTVSLGIAPSATGYERAEDILRDADTAMYRAKSLGKARHEIFDKAMHARAI